MDFMKIIESLDEALYTVMGWLVFYPMTLWRALVHPLAMMAYADREVSDAPDESPATSDDSSPLSPEPAARQGGRPPLAGALPAPRVDRRRAPGRRERALRRRGRARGRVRRGRRAAAV